MSDTSPNIGDLDTVPEAGAPEVTGCTRCAHADMDEGTFCCGALFSAQLEGRSERAEAIKGWMKATCEAGLWPKAAKGQLPLPEATGCPAHRASPLARLVSLMTSVADACPDLIKQGIAEQLAHPVSPDHLDLQEVIGDHALVTNGQWSLPLGKPRGLIDAAPKLARRLLAKQEELAKTQAALESAQATFAPPRGWAAGWSAQADGRRERFEATLGLTECVIDSEDGRIASHVLDGWRPGGDPQGHVQNLLVEQPTRPADGGQDEETSDRVRFTGRLRDLRTDLAVHGSCRDALQSTEHARQRAEVRAAKAETALADARQQVMDLQRLIDDVAAANATPRSPAASPGCLSDEALLQIEARYGQATGGTWTVEAHGQPAHANEPQPLALYAGRTDQWHGLRLLNLCDGDRFFEGNAAFIAAAHQDVPALLAEVRRLRQRLSAGAGHPMLVLDTDTVSSERLEQAISELTRLPSNAPIVVLPEGYGAPSSQPPEPEGWVFGPDLRRALDGKEAVGNDPLVLEVQQTRSALETSERALAEAQQHVRNLRVERDQLVGERDHAFEAADELAYAIAPATVIGEHTHLNYPWANALEQLEGQRAKLQEALASLEARRAQTQASNDTAFTRLAEAERAVRTLTSQLTAERETHQEMLALLEPIEGDGAVDPMRVLHLAATPHEEDEGEDVLEDLAEAAPRLARALIAQRGADLDRAGRCTCGMPMSRNPHPDAGKPTALLAVGASYVCIPCTVRGRHGWCEQASAAEREIDKARASYEAAVQETGRLRSGVTEALKMPWDAHPQGTGAMGYSCPDDIKIIAEARSVREQLDSERAQADMIRRKIAAERDRATRAADALAYAITPDSVIGRFAVPSDTWNKALKALAAERQRALVARLPAEPVEKDEAYTALQTLYAEAVAELDRLRAEVQATMTAADPEDSQRDAEIHMRLENLLLTRGHLATFQTHAPADVSHLLDTVRHLRVKLQTLTKVKESQHAEHHEALRLAEVDAAKLTLHWRPNLAVMLGLAQPTDLPAVLKAIDTLQKLLAAEQSRTSSLALNTLQIEDEATRQREVTQSLMAVIVHAGGVARRLTGLSERP